MRLHPTRVRVATNAHAMFTQTTSPIINQQSLPNAFSDGEDIFVDLTVAQGPRVFDDSYYEEVSEVSRVLLGATTTIITMATTGTTHPSFHLTPRPTTTIIRYLSHSVWRRVSVPAYKRSLWWPG